MKGTFAIGARIRVRETVFARSRRLFAPRRDARKQMKYAMNETQQFRRLLNSAVAVPIVIMGLLAAILCGQILQMTRVADLVDHTDTALATANECLKLIIDQETGLRGYMIGGQDVFLEPYRNAEWRLPDSFARLQDLIKDYPDQTQRLNEIRDDYAIWLEAVRQEIDLRNQTPDTSAYFNNSRTAALTANLRSRKELMDRIRQRFQIFTDVETKRRRERNNASQTAARITLFSTMGASVGIGALLAFFTRRRLLELGQTFGEALQTEQAARIEADSERIKTAEKSREVEVLNAELDQRVRERTAELAATNAELEAFSYSVSHDLRAPLRSIDGFSAALVEDYGEAFDATGKNYLDRIRFNSQTMADLIDGLLTLSRLTRAEMRRETVNLSDIAADIIQQMRERNPQRQVSVVIAPHLAAQGDGRLLRNVLENLLGNAWKFTGKTDAARIEFGAAPQEGQTVYFVRDNGAGFDMTYANKLFGAFQRLHGAKEYEGTGIGLATVQRIIRRHGGAHLGGWQGGRGRDILFYAVREKARSHKKNISLPIFYVVASVANFRLPLLNSGF